MDNLQTWDEFIDKIRTIKQEKLIDKVSAPALANLIFVGAFDELLKDRLATGNIIDVYKNAFEEIKTATGSKASLPKKTKNAIVGIVDIKTEAHLAMWRQSSSPLGVYPFLNSLGDNLRILGYTWNEERGQFRKHDDKGRIHIVTDEWERIFSLYDTNFWPMIQSKKFVFHIVGVVTNLKTSMYHNNSKEMLKVSLFTGRENIEDLVIWPERDTNKVSPFLKTQLQTGNIYLCEIMPKYDGKRKQGYIYNVQKFQS